MLTDHRQSNALPCFLRPRSFIEGQRLSLLLAILLLSHRAATATPEITEFMASNKGTLADEDGAFSDWIEIYNPDATAVSLDGWYLTDNAAKKTKWKFPAVTIPSDGYLMVFASDKNRRDPAATLHTNFALSTDGEYLGLIQSDGVTVASEFSPKFPAQLADVSYGVTQPTDPDEAPQTGFFSTPTPGAANGGAEALSIPQTVAYSRPAGLFFGTTTVTLSGASTGQTIRYVTAVASASGAALADPNSTSPEYTAPLTFTSSVIVKAAVFSVDGARRGLVSSAQFVSVDNSTSRRLDTFSSKLPLIVLDNHGYGAIEKDGVDRPAWFYGFNPIAGSTSLSSSASYQAAISFAVRGSSSASFDKKSYKFDLLDPLGQETSLPLFGLTSFEDWNLIGPWDPDCSYIRNAVVYELARKMGHWAPRTQLAEVFFNNDGGRLDYEDYAGIYVLTDKMEIDPNRVAITKISSTDNDASTISGGYLLRVDEDDSTKLAWKTNRDNPQNNWGSVLLVDEPKLAKLSTPQCTYIQSYVQQMEDALYSDQENNWNSRRYLDYIDRASWVDYHLLNVLAKNVDAFWRSTYYTKDRGGKIVAGPVWDYDRSMDSDDDRDNDPESWSESVQYWDTGWWGVIARDPDFMQAWIDRWIGLRGGQFSDENLAAVVTGFADQIGADAAARDAARWPDNVSTHGDFAGEISHLVDWLTRRARWIDKQFLVSSTVRNRGTLLTVTPPAGAQFAYTLDGTDPRASGGGLAPTAQLSAIPLAFTSYDQLRVRSYDPSMASSFPGSPWSLLQTPAGAAPSDTSSNAELPAFSSGGSGGATTAYTGATVSFSVTVSGIGPFTYQWYYNGTLLADATSSTLTLGSLTLAQEGSYTVQVSNAFGSVTSSAFVLTMVPAIRLANISARGEVGVGDNVLIAGFVISGSGTKNFLTRAVGPGLLSLGISDPVVSPTLRVQALDGTVLASNQVWGTGTEASLIPAAASQVGAFALAAGSNDAALLVHLPAGIYTLQASPGDGVGRIGLLELYATDERSYPVNLSARGRVAAGDFVLIGGFVVSGTGTQRVLLRGVGPTLSTQGVTTPLADPVLDLTQNGQVVAHNDDWSTGTNAAAISATAVQVGAFSLLAGSKDAVVLTDLAPGVYSVVVSGKANASGIALLEIYAVP